MFRSSLERFCPFTKPTKPWLFGRVFCNEKCEETARNCWLKNEMFTWYREPVISCEMVPVGRPSLAGVQQDSHMEFVLLKYFSNCDELPSLSTRVRNISNSFHSQKSKNFKETQVVDLTFLTLTWGELFEDSLLQWGLHWTWESLTGW